MNKSEARELLLKEDVKLRPVGWDRIKWVKFEKENLFFIDNHNNLVKWDRFGEEMEFEIYKEPKKKVLHYRRKWHQYSFGESVNDQLDWSKSKDAFDRLHSGMDITSRSDDWEEKEFEVD